MPPLKEKKVVRFSTVVETTKTTENNNKTTKTTHQEYFVVGGLKFNLSTPLGTFIFYMRYKNFSREYLYFTNKFKQQVKLQQPQNIPSVSRSYLTKLRNGSPFSILQGNLLTVADYFYALATLPGKSHSLFYRPPLETKNYPFDEFVSRIDPFYSLNFCLAEKAWAQHTPVIRNRVAAITQFEKKCNKLPKTEIILPDFTSPRPQDWKLFGDALRHHWRDSYLRDFTHVEAQQYLHRWQTLSAECLQDFKDSRSLTRHPSTQKWCRPPGVNKILLNSLVHHFYEFHDGNDIFHISFPDEGEDFFSRSHIKDGAMLNPPYKPPLLTPIIVKLVHWAVEFRRVFAVLVPFEPDSEWFILCQELKYPIFRLDKKLAFLRGPEKQWCSTAKFQSCWILIGANTSVPEFSINNDMFGYPLDLSYVLSFKKICFPHNAMSSYPRITIRGLNIRMKIFQALFHVARTHDSIREASDLTKTFDLKEMTKFNFLLQTVRPSDHNFTETCSDIKLDRYLQQHATWPSFKGERASLTYPQLEDFLKRFENSPCPKDKTRDFQCIICKKMGHIARLCPHRIPEISELGLVDRLDIFMYQYLATLDYNLYKNQPLDHFRAPDVFERRLSKWLRTEALFWRNFQKFLAKRDISDISAFSNNEEFSKGRKSLGFNYAMGAQQPELILDAFGAVLDLVEPPPPCEYVPSGSNSNARISPEMAAEDLKELKRRTCYRVPKKHIKWILPRFSVSNSDQTTRHINDCRYLGPATITNRFRLPSRQELRKFAPGDLVLAIDGKSAYKQRRLAWGDRNKIGFKTNIHNQDCYIVMVTLPFGLHNAGFIYQISLKRKLQRIVGHLFFIEYIDDVTIRFAHKGEAHVATQWTANALLYLTSKIGEIFNNKIEVFTDCITMLGVNFFPKTDRFTPKISTFHKLGVCFFDLLSNQKFSIKHLSSVIGLLNWMLPDQFKYLKAPLIGALQKAEKERDLVNKHNPHKKQISDKTLFWPVTSAFADTTFELMLKITEQYLYTAIPHYDISGSTIFIVVDSNPFVAGGFVFFQQQESSFFPLSQLSPERIDISQLPEEFIKSHDLRDIFHSFRFEAVGLLAFLQKAGQHIRKLALSANNVIVLNDNRGLVQKLHKGNANHPLAYILHQEIFDFLRSLELPYDFRWLPRDHPYIAAADKLGRPRSSDVFKLTAISESMIEAVYPGKLYTPECFLCFENFTYLMPKHIFAWETREGRPFLLIPPSIKLRQLQLTLSWLTQLDNPIIVCFPRLRRGFVDKFLNTNLPVISINIRPEYFLGLEKVLPRYNKNFPMLCGTIQQLDKHPYVL